MNLKPLLRVQSPQLFVVDQDAFAAEQEQILETLNVIQRLCLAESLNSASANAKMRDLYVCLQVTIPETGDQAGEAISVRGLASRP
jgi:hypothetical protein